MNWVLVADASRARLFAAAGPRAERITEIADFVNPAAKAKEDELASHSAGEGRPGARSAPEEPSAAEHSAGAFSRHLSDYLESARNEHRYEHVYLVAEPKFLGRLRHDLSPAVRRLVAGEVDKDLSWFGPNEMAEYLKKHVL